MSRTYKSFQDFEATPIAERPEFIKNAINEYTKSKEFTDAKTGLNYYKRKNEKILARMSLIEKVLKKRIQMTYHRLPNGLFSKMTDQVIFYTIGSGLTMDADKKKILGKKFEKTLIEACTYAFWGKIAWLFPQRVKENLYEVRKFSALEAFGLFDEENGAVRLVIKFHQLSDDKPMNVELFEADGLTKYQIKDGIIKETEPKKPYKFKKTTDILGERIEPDGEYSTFPVVPLYANMLHEPEFTQAFKAYADAYDFINSDLIDTITQIEGWYWDFVNYGGEDALELVETIQTFKAVTSDGDNAKATSHLLESPYQGKQATLASLKSDMYNDFMALDMKALTGGSLTNVAINVAKTDLDLKADKLEWQVADAVENIMVVVGMDYEEPKFKRQTISNDTENIENISMQLSDGYIDKIEAVYLAPNILESRKKPLLKRLAIAEQEQADATFELEQDEDEADTAEDVEG